MKVNTLQQLISNMFEIEKKGCEEEDFKAMWEKLWKIYSLMNEVRELQMSILLRKNESTS